MRAGQPAPKSTWTDVRWGIGWGASFAAFYSLWVIAVFLISGEEPLREKHLTLGRTIAFYAVGGPTAGAIVGLLKPLTRTRLGAYVVAVLAATPILIGASLAMYGPIARWDEDTWISLPISILALAAVYSFAAWEPQD